MPRLVSRLASGQAAEEGSGMGSVGVKTRSKLGTDGSLIGVGVEDTCEKRAEGRR